MPLNILYLSPIPFDSIKQRPQYLAEQLAEVHNVTYVEPTLSFIHKLIKGNEYKKKSYSISNKLHVLRLNGLFSIHRVMDGVMPFGLHSLWERIQLRKLLQKTDLIWIGYCGWYPLIEKSKLPIVYDKMDDNELLIDNTRLKTLFERIANSFLLKKHIRRMDDALTVRANLMFVTAQVFYDKAKKKCKQVFIIPNAVNASLIPKQRHKNETDKIIFGYIGMIEHWFDMDAIKTIINANENNYIVLAGPNYLPEFKHKRVTYTGRVHKEQLADILSGFDICLYPFKKGALLDTINPVKIYEYLSMNKPVLAVKSIETEKFKKYIAIYDTLGQIIEICSKGFNKPFLDDKECKKFMMENCWDQRGAEIRDILSLDMR